MPDDATAPIWINDLPPLADLVTALAVLEDDVEGASDESVDDRAELEEIRLSLAIELEVRDGDNGAPRVTGSTPTQWTETTVLPSFHRIAMRITRTITDA